MSALLPEAATHAWQVFLLFVIPVGGGIPAGVLLAQSYGFSWLGTGLIYFVSDVVLALAFEPLMSLFVFISKRVRFLARMREAFVQSTNRTIAKYGTKPGPFLLVVIAFGVDPMTGRAAARAHGHGFLSGWAIAILGDMCFFTLIMVSTIALKGVLGDGTWTAVIIMLAMVVVPALFRKLKKQLNKDLSK